MQGAMRNPIAAPLPAARRLLLAGALALLAGCAGAADPARGLTGRQVADRLAAIIADDALPDLERVKRDLGLREQSRDQWSYLERTGFSANLVGVSPAAPFASGMWTTSDQFVAVSPLGVRLQDLRLETREPAAGIGDVCITRADLRRHFGDRAGVYTSEFRHQRPRDRANPSGLVYLIGRYRLLLEFAATPCVLALGLERYQANLEPVR
jgi:hypothetical protein